MGVRLAQETIQPSGYVYIMRLKIIMTKNIYVFFYSIVCLPVGVAANVTQEGGEGKEFSHIW